MKKPAELGGFLACQDGLSDTRENTRSPHDPQGAARAISLGLVAGRGPIELSNAVRRWCTPREIVDHAAACVWALHPRTALNFARAVETDAIAALAGPVEAEAERKRRRWREFCRSRLKRPVLSAADTRRAAALCFDDDPRSALVAAWEGASDRDRRDLIERVTGRAV